MPESMTLHVSADRLADAAGRFAALEKLLVRETDERRYHVTLGVDPSGQHLIMAGQFAGQMRDEPAMRVRMLVAEGPFPPALHGRAVVTSSMDILLRLQKLQGKVDRSSRVPGDVGITVESRCLRFDTTRGVRDVPTFPHEMPLPGWNRPTGEFVQAPQEGGTLDHAFGVPQIVDDWTALEAYGADAHRPFGPANQGVVLAHDGWAVGVVGSSWVVTKGRERAPGQRSDLASDVVVLPKRQLLAASLLAASAGRDTQLRALASVKGMETDAFVELVDGVMVHASLAVRAKVVEALASLVGQAELWASFDVTEVKDAQDPHQERWNRIAAAGSEVEREIETAIRGTLADIDPSLLATLEQSRAEPAAMRWRAINQLAQRALKMAMASSTPVFRAAMAIAGREQGRVAVEQVVGDVSLIHTPAGRAAVRDLLRAHAHNEAARGRLIDDILLPLAQAHGGTRTLHEWRAETRAGRDESPLLAQIGRAVRGDLVVPSSVKVQMDLFAERPDRAVVTREAVSRLYAIEGFQARYCDQARAEALMPMVQRASVQDDTVIHFPGVEIADRSPAMQDLPRVVTMLDAVAQRGATIGAATEWVAGVRGADIKALAESMQRLAAWRPGLLRSQAGVYAAVFLDRPDTERPAVAVQGVGDVMDQRATLRVLGFGFNGEREFTLSAVTHQGAFDAMPAMIPVDSLLRATESLQDDEIVTVSSVRSGTAPASLAIGAQKAFVVAPGTDVAMMPEHLRSDMIAVVQLAAQRWQSHDQVTGRLAEVLATRARVERAQALAAAATTMPVTGHRVPREVLEVAEEMKAASGPRRR